MFVLITDHYDCTEPNELKPEDFEFIWVMVYLIWTSHLYAAKSYKRKQVSLSRPGREKKKRISKNCEDIFYLLFSNSGNIINRTEVIPGCTKSGNCGSIESGLRNIETYHPFMTAREYGNWLKHTPNCTDVPKPTIWGNEIGIPWKGRNSKTIKRQRNKLYYEMKKIQRSNGHSDK